MNKQHFLVKWGRSYTSAFESDLDALIEHEIAKAMKIPENGKPEATPVPELCESDAIDYIIKNSLNWKKLGNNRLFAIDIGRAGASFRVSFVEYNSTLTGTINRIIHKIDLSEWQPVETGIEPTEQPAKPKLNSIEKAYEDGKKIRKKEWNEDGWIKKYSDIKHISNIGNTSINYGWCNFKTNPELWEIYTEPEAQPEPAKPELNPIHQAYEQGIKIRKICWEKTQWIKKYSESKVIDEDFIIWLKEDWDVLSDPEEWELYTEPEATPSSQPEMGYHQKAKYIIDNKLTHKDASVKNCFAYAYYGCVFYFCDENGKDMFSTSFFTLDLSEWHPFQHNATPSSQPEMGYEEKATYIIENKLTHKDAMIKNCFANASLGTTFYFCDENGKEMFTMDFPSLDLSEWHPYQPKPTNTFERLRFEAMFRAVYASEPCNTLKQCIKETEDVLQQLDAYYASKEGGKNG